MSSPGAESRRRLDQIAPLTALTLLFLLGIPLGTASAQRDVSPVAAVERYFEALRERDTTAVRTVVAPDAQLTTAITRDGSRRLMTLSPSMLIDAVGRASGAEWRERLVRPEVHVDGDVAALWSRYTFHRGDAFDHCGVIAVQLVRTEAAWRIVHVVETHQYNGC